MRFDARELAVGLMPWNQGAASQEDTGDPDTVQAPNCGACTPATADEPTGAEEREARAGQLGLLRLQLGEALSQPGAR